MKIFRDITSLKPFLIADLQFFISILLNLSRSFLFKYLRFYAKLLLLQLTSQP